MIAILENKYVAGALLAIVLALGSWAGWEHHNVAEQAIGMAKCSESKAQAAIDDAITIQTLNTELAQQKVISDGQKKTIDDQYHAAQSQPLRVCVAARHPAVPATAQPGPIAHDPAPIDGSAMQSFEPVWSALRDAELDAQQVMDLQADVNACRSAMLSTSTDPLPLTGRQPSP